MTGHEFNLSGETLVAMASGALWWSRPGILVVSDLHLGKSDRIARRSGQMLPPYETQDTLARLEGDIEETHASTVICLGDSFDDLATADTLSETVLAWIVRLQAGRSWTWIEGNHDPGPIDLGGAHRAALNVAPLTFRHIAIARETAEISGHYHPKASLHARGKTVTRPAFLIDENRVIMPAYGTYTGGLRTTDPVFSGLMKPTACAVLTGHSATAIPFAGQKATP